MEKEEKIKIIMKLPKVETDNSISTMYGINVDDLICAIDRLNKVPTYDELLRENKRLKETMHKIKYILDNQINYREFVDMINDIEDILKKEK